MLKMAKAESISIKDDPRTIDRANWQNVSLAADNEAIHRDWRCALYRLHRTGKIDNDQREAGDKYATLIRDYRKQWVDPIGEIEIYRRTENLYVPDRVEGNRAVVQDVERALGWVAGAPLDESEFEVKRAQRLSKRYREARGVAGPAANILEDMLIHDIWPVGQRGHREICHALTRLYHFFATGNKRRT
jgi:hypothetical protein